MNFFCKSTSKWVMAFSIAAIVVLIGGADGKKKKPCCENESSDQKNRAKLTDYDYCRIDLLETVMDGDKCLYKVFLITDCDMMESIWDDCFKCESDCTYAPDACSNPSSNTCASYLEDAKGRKIPHNGKHRVTLFDQYGNHIFQWLDPQCFKPNIGDCQPGQGQPGSLMFHVKFRLPESFRRKKGEPIERCAHVRLVQIPNPTQGNSKRLPLNSIVPIAIEIGQRPREDAKKTYEGQVLYCYEFPDGNRAARVVFEVGREIEFVVPLLQPEPTQGKSK